MPQSLSYPYEKFMVAVSAMATSPRSIKDRLKSAFMSFHTLKDDDFADYPDMLEQWQKIYGGLTSQKAVGDEGDVQATINEMTEEEAVAMADKIFNLFLEIAGTNP